jgi:hypothetical protein
LFAVTRHAFEQYFAMGAARRNGRPQTAHGRGAVDGFRSGWSLTSGPPHTEWVVYDGQMTD